MPTTYNGVGTHYYGKRNVETRQATCQSCGRPTALVSYDTRLWFVVLFIPVIPLGRKRILDDCSSCRRHYAIDADKWETQKQLGISGALETYEADPTPEAAMGLHQTMLNFHQSAQAAEFRRGMVEKFSTNAHVHAYLGEALGRTGHSAESASHFTRALDLRPDLPEARVGVARQHLAVRRLDEARALLDFLEKPGAEQLYSLEPLEILADAYRGAGQHAPALEIYRRLLAGLPVIGQIPGFRKKVKVSEKALRSPTTMLPKRQWSWKNLLGNGSRWRSLGLVGIVLLLIGVGVIISNEYCRRHRKLYVVNATAADTTVTVRAPGADRTLRLARAESGPNGVQPSKETLQLPEGRYRVLVSGAAQEEFDLEVRSGYWDRWDDSAWLINVGGAAQLIAEHVTYRADPPPASFELRYGRPTEFFPKITHAFTDLPETLHLKSGETRVLTRLYFARGAGTGLLGLLMQQHRDGEALDFAEWLLRRHPSDETLLQTYPALALQMRQMPRAERVLLAGLATRPINIPWHRAYQNLHLTRADEGALLAQYDRLLAAEPENPALLYLRGRIGLEGAVLFQRALQLDPTHSYASFALGYDRLAVGDAAGARPLLATAAAGVPDSAQFAELLWQCRFALRETDALETEARAAIRSEPSAVQATERLIDLLASRGAKEEIAKTVTAFQRSVAALPPSDRTTLAGLVRRYGLYAIGDFSALEKDAASDRSPAGRQSLVIALIEQGRAAEAVKVRPLSTMTAEDDWQCLVVSLALRQAGDTAAADAWLERGAQWLEEGNSTEQQCARLLRAATAPDLAEVAALKTFSTTKAIVLAALAARHPAPRRDLHKLLRQLPLPRAFPHSFLQRLAAGEK